MNASHIFAPSVTFNLAPLNIIFYCLNSPLLMRY